MNLSKDNMMQNLQKANSDVRLEAHLKNKITSQNPGPGFYNTLNTSLKDKV